MVLLDYYRHRRDCTFKRNQRAARISELSHFQNPFSVLDRTTITRPIQDLVKDVHSNPESAKDVLATYTKVALKAHERTNCLTEVMIKSAEHWLQDGSINLKGPLAGVPLSLKDTVEVPGYDTTVGQSKWVGNAKDYDMPLMKLLKDAGAVPYVKTNIPCTLLSFESQNDVWGKTTNAYNPKYSPGGSTGGEGALLALGGRIGIGSDVAGSVRLPAHWSGVYSIRCSIGRWPKNGIVSSLPGQEGVPSVYSPMARTLNDLTYFTRSIIEMKPWKYDYYCHPLEWRPEIEKDYAAKSKLRIGVMRTDGVIDPSPACKRALEMTEAALRAQGHEMIEINPPSPYEALRLASRLINADGLDTAASNFRWGEWNDRGVARMRFYMRLPRPLKYLYYLWVRYVRGDTIWAGLLGDFHKKSAGGLWKLQAERESFKARWFEWWQAADLDFIIAPPNATPALPHNGMHDAVSSCGYTFLFNLIDYTAGVLPVTHVDRIKDRLPADFRLNNLNGAAQGAYKHYDADAMHGLPVGVQVIGQRLQEEKVLALMKRVEEALGDDKFELLSVE
ncbi:amidase domain-containing protein [Sarocladium implicatum]|nr:amidase domain-containing protein [Sarocladium implicatum]